LSHLGPLLTGHEIAKEIRHQLLHYLPHLGRVTVYVDPYEQGGKRHHRIVPDAHDGLAAPSHN
jgi:divalent metal cation (Fe/Co/Zn/Cd) transporter